MRGGQHRRGGGRLKTRGAGIKTRGAGIKTRGAGIKTRGAGIKNRGAGIKAWGGQISDPQRRQFAKIGKRFLGHKKDAVAARTKLMRLDEPYVNVITDAAAAIRSTKLDASARSAGKKATQGSLDKKDGEAFFLLEAIIDAFEKAHDIDPTIPRLVPISMRRHFGKHTRKAPIAPEPTGDDSTKKK
jgi:hypothetical protein